MNKDTRPPKIKICGLTRPEQAEACARFSIAAIGLIFYPKSKRHVSDAQAREIVNVIPAEIHRVGVFVNPTAEEVLDKVSNVGLTAVQLHGKEPATVIDRLRKENIWVIKALFEGGTPGLDAVVTYAQASSYLVECGKGTHPGGNALSWDWSAARPFAEQYPLILAGGLTPANVGTAIQSCHPHAVDVSSGVEHSPGIKDLAKVAAFVEKVGEYHYISAENKTFPHI